MRKLSTVVAASSGVAALELHGGRTVHSAFSIPVTTLDANTLCGISKQSKQASALRNASAVFWDEISMADRFAEEAVHRGLQVILTFNKSE